jgi:putative MATE family efflux protein
LRDLTVGKVGPLIFKFALPMLIGNVFQQMYNVVDSIIVGNYLGKEALSAVGASFPIFFALISLVIGLASGAGTVVSQNFGAKKMREVQLAVDTMFIIMLVSSIFISIVGIFFAESILRLIDLPESIIPQAKIYLIITLAGVYLLFGFNGVQAVLRSLGDSKTPLYFLIISTITNIILVLLFVMVFHWGIAGAAVATVIAQGGAFFTGVVYINRTSKLIHINLFNLKFDKTILIQSIKIGLPMGMQQMFVALGMTALFKIVNGYGTSVIAAYTVAGRIDTFAMMPAMNFAQALTSFVGQNIGAGKIDRVKRGLLATWLYSSAISIVIALVVFLWGDKLMGLFTNDQEVIAVGQHYFYIVGGFYVVFSTMFSFTGVFRGAGDTLIPMFITLFSLWLIRIPLAWNLSEIYGVSGIWAAIPTAWTFGMIVSIIYFSIGRWKTKTVVKIADVLGD